MHDATPPEECRATEHDRLLRLWNVLPALVGSIDRSLVYRSVNRAYQSWFGLSPEEIVGRPVREVLGDEAFAIVEPWLAAALEGRLVQHEATIPYRHGGTRHVLVIHAPDVDERGEVLGVLVLVHDLSERRAAEDRLGDREREFRALFELAATGMAQVDPTTGRFVRVNQKLCELTGYTEAQLVGRTYSELTHPDDRARDEALVRPVLRGERDAWEIEKRYLRRDGGVVWVIVSGRLTRDDQGRPLRAFSSVLDIDARRRAEQQVRDAAAEFDAFFELSGSGKVRVDPGTGHFVRVNRRFVELVGYSPEELLGLGLDDLTHPEDRTREPAADTFGHEVEKRFVRKDGGVVWVRVDTSVLPDGPGPARGILASIRDITAEKEAERAVHESEARFRGLFEGSPIPILVEDFSAAAARIAELRAGGADLVAALSEPDEVVRIARLVRVLEASPAGVPFFGAREKADLLTTVADYLADGEPEAWDVFRDELVAFARGETTFTAHYTLRQPGRADRSVLLSLAVAPGHERALDRVLLTFVDLTERQRAEAELRAAKDWLEVVLGGISDGFLVFDRGYRFRFVGAVDAERFRGSGLEPASLLGRTLWEVFPHLQPEAVDALHRAMEERTPVSFEAQLSQHRWYEVRAYPTADGGISLLSPDITERKRVEAELHDSRAMLEASQRMAHVGSWVLHLDDDDLQRGELHWSDETFRIFGWDPGEVEVTNDRFFDQVHPDDRAAVREAVADALRRGSSYRVQHRIRRPNGEERVVEEWAVVDPGLDGQPHRMLGTVQDVTDRVWAERALREADRRKDEFLAILAHELRNPLAPIRSSVAVLRAARATPEQRDWARDVIERQIGHMARLLDDLLDVSRITRDNLELRRERTEVARVVQLALETSRPLLDAARHEVVVVVPDEPIQVDGDPVRLSQIFANLLNNAAKYTPEGGRIDIQVAPRGPEVIVTVRDNGIGIAPDALPHLFEMFSQIQPSARRAQGGLGIGLALVRGLVELHGGRIEAHSDGVGRGTCFDVHLPRLLAPADQAVSVQPERPQRRHRVVVADDQHDAADSLAMLLRHEGYDVRTAYDGEEALAATREARPEIVVLDIGMPKLDGYETARAIRSSPWGRDVVLIAATGWGQDEDRRRALTAGFDHHLTKPIDPDALLDLLSKVEETPAPP